MIEEAFVIPAKGTEHRCSNKLVSWYSRDLKCYKRATQRYWDEQEQDE